MNYYEKEESGKTVLAAEGALNTSEAPEFQKELLSVLNTHKDVILDFSEVPYICSAGLRALMAAQQFVDESEDKTFVIRNICAEVMDVFEITGFSNVLMLEP